MLNDISKLLLRVNLAILMLFHGFNKIIHGIESIRIILKSSGLHDIFAYGVYIGEVIAPLFILLGFYARVSSVIVAINMVVAIYLVHRGEIFSIGTHGSLAIEVPLFYLVSAVVIVMLGSGKYAINSK